MNDVKNIWDNENLVSVLMNGGVAVMPTDTIYGIVARAEDKNAVQKIYEIKNRQKDKKLINLISDWDETKRLGVDSSKFKIPEYVTPTTFILDDTSFRLPQNEELRKLLRKTGPLVAPSANKEGQAPAKNIDEAKEYFKDSVDIYVDGGIVEGKASKLIKLHKDGSMSILRE